MTFSAPTGRDVQEFLPWGEEGEFYCVRGWMEARPFLEGVMAAMVSMDGVGFIAESLEYHDKHVLPWMNDDEDKPEAVYEGELRTAFYEVHEGDVRQWWARFWTEEHALFAANPYKDYDGGVEVWVKVKHGPIENQPDILPPFVMVTYLREH